MEESFEPRKPGQNALEEEETIASSDADPKEPKPEGPGSDQPIFELIDIIGKNSEANSDPAEDESEVIIDLTDIVQEESMPLDDMLVAEIEDGHEGDDGFAESLGMDLEESSPSSSVTPNQVEEAIERVVRKMLSKKIDHLLMKVIEKEVSKELERIRKLLIEELPDSDNL
ncbi:MAG: hypothetical protein C4530_23140 [Desulfobacteraceae bacterium]|nr:MAG: hypothetical protein C4530_23140 [Desulfobacteraceae bacterium]